MMYAHINLPVDQTKRKPFAFYPYQIHTRFIIAGIHVMPLLLKIETNKWKKRYDKADDIPHRATTNLQTIENKRINSKKKIAAEKQIDFSKKVFNVFVGWLIVCVIFVHLKVWIARKVATIFDYCCLLTNYS